jgi:hypothetical protein
MRFTWYAVFLPLLLNLTIRLFSPAINHEWPGGPLWKITAFWFVCGFPCAAVYWLVRLVRCAWQDGSATRPAPEMLEASAPDSGRIFGRLN